jgi:subtilisin-like proprotein convertase family protein
MKVEITSDGCEGTPTEVAHLEHVQLTVSLRFPRRGDLKISLTSPSGK